MSRTTYDCDGCGALLRSKRDLAAEHGHVRPTWKCRRCGTTVPAIVAEKIKHQKQHEPSG